MRGFNQLNRLLLLAVAYALCMNVALALRRRYEAGVFLLLGVAHVLSRLERSRPPSASQGGALWRVVLVGLTLVIAFLTMRALR